MRELKVKDIFANARYKGKATEYQINYAWDNNGCKEKYHIGERYCKMHIGCKACFNLTIEEMNKFEHPKRLNPCAEILLDPLESLDQTRPLTAENIREAETILTNCPRRSAIVLPPVPTWITNEIRTMNMTYATTPTFEGINEVETTDGFYND